jgi:hypothetical protein
VEMSGMTVDRRAGHADAVARAYGLPGTKVTLVRAEEHRGAGDGRIAGSMPSAFRPQSAPAWRAIRRRRSRARRAPAKGEVEQHRPCPWRVGPGLTPSPSVQVPRPVPPAGDHVAAHPAARRG